MEQKNRNHLGTDKKLFKCPECGFHYEEKKHADQCEAWCKKHKSCNLDIISRAAENNKNKFNKNHGT